MRGFYLSNTLIPHYRSLASNGSTTNRDRLVKRCAFAGIAAGMLPLAHAHSFMVVILVAGFLTIFFGRLRLWAVFFGFALLLGLPQVITTVRGSAVSAGGFFGWQLGWMKGNEEFLWFWFKNTGVFAPLVMFGMWIALNRRIFKKDLAEPNSSNSSKAARAAFLPGSYDSSRAVDAAVATPHSWRQRYALLFFYLPFLVCFIVPKYGPACSLGLGQYQGLNLLVRRINTVRCFGSCPISHAKKLGAEIDRGGCFGFVMHFRIA